MVIEDLFVSQCVLRRAGQIPTLVFAIHRGDRIPPIRLSEADDGTVQIDDGHHRAVAYWLSGRQTLAPGEYLLIQTDSARRRTGKFSKLIANVCASASSEKHSPPIEPLLGTTRSEAIHDKLA